MEKLSSRSASGGGTALLWEARAHPGELTTRPRTIRVHAQLPVSGVGAGTGLMVLNLGYARDPGGPFFRKLRRAFADRYDCVCIGVEYMGTRLMAGRHLSLVSLDREALLEELGRADRVQLLGERTLALDSPAVRGLDLRRVARLQEHVPGIDREEYLDYGPAQALDILFAVREAVERLELNERRIYFFGSSLAGFLGHLAHKLAPRTFAGLFEVSGPPTIPQGRFYRGGEAPVIVNDFNTSATLVCENVFTPAPGHPHSLTPAMLELRDTTRPEHLQPSPTIVRSLHGELDVVTPPQEKREQAAAYRAVGRDVELQVIGAQEVDGDTYRHAGHALGANFYPLLTQLADRHCDPGAPGAGEWEGDTQRVYELPVSGGVYTVDHRGTRPQLTFRQ